MKTRILAAVLGGLFIGVISIIPIIGWLWFIWAVIGGVLATLIQYLFVRQNIKIIDGVWAGAGAGLVGAIVNVVGVTLWGVIASAFVAFVRDDASGDKMGLFVSSFAFSLPGILLNVVFGIPIILLAFGFGTLLAFILSSINAKPQPSPNPFYR